MLNVKKIIEENGKLICETNQGILKEGSTVTLDSDYKGELNPFFLRSDREYLVSEILNDSLYSRISLIIKGYEEEPVYCYYLNLLNRRDFNVFKWKGYYILAESIDQASEVWEKSGLVEKEQDQELFPYQLKRIKAEANNPCIVDDLDWEEILFELKH